MMRKLLFLACLGAIVLTGCDNGKSSQELENIRLKDSLNNIIAQKNGELDDLMGTFNEIEQGFREINEAENRVALAQNGEGANKKQAIRENIKFIADRMKQNKELIAKLKKQLNSSSFKGQQLQKTLENLTKQLEEKDKQLQEIRMELDAKDIHIAELDETVNNLITTAGDLSSENQRKTETISAQDQQINTAWYAYGTKKELKKQGIYEHRKVLNGNFNRSYFTKIDIRQTKEIKLYSKSVKIMTAHPSGSYLLYEDVNKQYILKITNPQLFWSTSKYLVVMVK